MSRGSKTSNTVLGNCFENGADWFTSNPSGYHIKNVGTPFAGFRVVRTCLVLCQVKGQAYYYRGYEANICTITGYEYQIRTSPGVGFRVVKNVS